MMLSRNDIFRELGKQLCIYPVIFDNIKENSINISSSEYAWTQEGGTAYWYGGKDFRISSKNGAPKKTHTFKKGEKSIFIIKENNGEDKKYLILFPHQTTNVESLEVLALGKKIGGAVHSKVGIVMKGIGDCGTMLGPEYCGHLLISLHNITDDIIAIDIGETVASLTFDYLKTPVKRMSNTISSHKDKLLERKFDLSDEDSAYFSEDWKSNFFSINQKMKKSESYNQFCREYSKTIGAQIKDFFNLRNVFLILGAIAILLFFHWGAYKLDQKLTDPVWVDRYYNIFVVAIVAILLSAYGKLFKR